jgi:malonyl-ACP O-methyltransferase BioC
MVNRSVSSPLKALSPDKLFDRALVKNHRDRIASTYPNHSFLKDRTVNDLVGRLKHIRRTFSTCVDLGCHTGQLSRAFKEIATNEIICADMSYGMLQTVPSSLKLVMDEEQLPFDSNSLDLILSSLSLHWVNDLPGLMSQVMQCLKPDGLFLASVLGENTLLELRDCLMSVEIEIKSGLSPRVSPMMTLQDAGTLLQRAGFALPVVDLDHVQVTYAHPMDLLHDLRQMGETNALNTRSQSIMSRTLLQRMCELYQQKYSFSDGRIYATFDIITMTGWKPHSSQPKPLKRGSAKSKLSDYL